MSRLVADASPLISLSAAGRLDLLRHFVDLVIVPDRVWTESVVAGKPGSAAIASAVWIEVVSVRDVGLVRQLRRELGSGESEAIALAKELGTLALIDERRARKVAAREGVPVVGTVGVLLHLKGIGVLPAVRPVVEDLLAAGWRASAALLKGLFQAAGE